MLTPLTFQLCHRQTMCGHEPPFFSSNCLQVFVCFQTLLLEPHMEATQIDSANLQQTKNGPTNCVATLLVSSWKFNTLIWCGLICCNMPTIKFVSAPCVNNMSIQREYKQDKKISSQISFLFFYSTLCFWKSLVNYNNSRKIYYKWHLSRLEYFDRKNLTSRNQKCWLA